MSEIEAIVGVDPGVAVGLCRVYPSVGFELAWTLDHLNACDWIHDCAKHYGPRVLFVYEVFRPRPHVAWIPEAVEVTGVIKWASWKFGCGLVDQSVSDAKTFATNDRLREIGWWSRGQSTHARDAARHVLLYLARAQRYDGHNVLWGEKR